MTNKKFLLVFFIYSLMISLAWAERGGWVSSGGEIFKYDRNPWFVKNTQQVNYCVQIDTTTFSASPQVIRQKIQDSLSWWVQEISGQKNSGMGIAQIATQKWVEISDCAQADLAFKFGYGTLSQVEPDNEVEFLKTPEIYIGVSVRKEYDLKTMKGKGFIYIASDIGPHAYKNSGTLISQAWQNPKFLQYALMHELGHVFGLPHTGVGLMSEVFLDQLLNKNISTFYNKYPIQPFLTYPKNFEVCTLSGQFDINFFQIKEETACLMFEALPNVDLAWKVFTKKYASSTPVEHGTVKANSSGSGSYQPAIIVHLPEEQNVFSASEKGFASFMVGGVFTDLSTQAFFQTSTSLKPYPVSLILKANEVTMIGTDSSGKIKNVMVYSPPQLLHALFPIK